MDLTHPLAYATYVSRQGSPLTDPEVSWRVGDNFYSTYYRTIFTRYYTRYCTFFSCIDSR
jgi:hypothetical protein